MFCFKCGAQIPDESVFCSKCGAKVQALPEPTAQTYTLTFDRASQVYVANPPISRPALIKSSCPDPSAPPRRMSICSATPLSKSASVGSPVNWSPR